MFDLTNFKDTWVFAPQPPLLSPRMFCFVYPEVNFAAALSIFSHATLPCSSF